MYMNGGGWSSFNCTCYKANKKHLDKINRIYWMKKLLTTENTRNTKKRVLWCRSMVF